MALPTSGFTTGIVRYTVNFGGTEVPHGFTFPIDRFLFHSGDPVLSEQRTEELMAAIDAGLQAFADAVDQHSNVTVYVSKTYEASIMSNVVEP